MAWYNKYRPTRFDAASGQELVKRVLQNSVRTVFDSNPKIKHAYLLSGPRGTGKTSLARIFARSINCLDDQTTKNEGEACGICNVCKNGQIDIIELDAASNTGIDNIRDLIEAANTPPFISRYKVYIIDEVHMLSKAAMNALLKTLEEPPSYIVFLMATTDPEKILNTILSRVTHLKLINHTVADISKLLTKISEIEDLSITIDALNLISKIANGGLRDAINLLETISNYNLTTYTEPEVAQILGVLPSTRLENLANTLNKGTLKDLKPLIVEFEALGSDPEVLLSQVLDHLLSSALENYIQTEKLDTQNDNLITVLSDILGSRLNLGSIQSALTLVKIRLPQNSSTPNQELPPSTKPILTTENIVSLKPQPEIQKIQAIPIIESRVNLEFDENETVTKSNFRDLIESELNSANFPIMLKTFWQSIETFEDSNQIYLYLPNKTFILPLKSSRINEWFKALVQKNYDKEKFIKIVTEDDIENYHKIQFLIDQKKANPTEEKSNQAPKDKNEVHQIEPETTQETPQKTKNEDFTVSDFYYLYKALPDGSIPKGMKLWSQRQADVDLANTETENTTHIDHWQNELQDLDLE